MNLFERKNLEEERIHIEFLFRTLLTNYNSMKYLLLRDGHIESSSGLKEEIQELLSSNSELLELKKNLTNLR